MKPVIYLGPSLPIAEARKILDADYRLPVKRGDLAHLDDDVRLVGIIDGILMSDSAVGHREILSLLKRNIVVVGGGSMGALRAAELRECGMIGVGMIFELYSSGKIEGDDEVVLMYDPHTQAALSEPLINIRLNLEEATKLGILNNDQLSMLINAMKGIYFPKRSYDSLISYAKTILDANTLNRLSEFIEKSRKDFKEIDAKTVLLAVKDKIENH